MPRTKKAETAATPVTKTSKKETVEAKVAVAPKATQGLTIDVFDITGNKTTMALPEEVFGAKINKSLMAQAVRVYLANKRMGGAKAQTRGEVSGSTRKIYQQKGTGRARHGGIRAPIFVGGGAAHGPRPHDFSLSMPKKMRRLALFSALSSKKAEGKVMVVKGLDGVEAKTKAMVAVLKKMNMDAKQTSMMLVLPTTAQTNILKAARNIAGVTIVPVNQLNTYTVLQNQAVVFMQEAVSLVGKARKEA